MKRWTIWVAAFAVGALACGAPAKDNSGTAPIQPADTTAAATTQAPAPPASTAAAQPAGNTIGEGTWRVPEQVQPGTYQTKVPPESYGCYWERMKDLAGGFDAIISNGHTDKGGQATVKILATDKGFKSQGCGTWTKVG